MAAQSQHNHISSMAAAVPPAATGRKKAADEAAATAQTHTDPDGSREAGELPSGDQPGSAGAKRPRITAGEGAEDRGGGEEGEGAGRRASQNHATSSAPSQNHQQGSQPPHSHSGTVPRPPTASFSENTAGSSNGGTADRLPDGLSGAEPYMSPEELLRHYWLLQLQAKEAEATRAVAAATAAQDGQTGSAEARQGETGERAVPGGTGHQVPLSAHAQGSSHLPPVPLPPTDHLGGFAPKFHASSPVASLSQLLPGQLEGGADISALLPQLEVLASSLQNPMAVESAQYIAALTQNQVLSTLANAAAATAGQLLAPGPDNSKHQATVATNLELISALAGSADMGKYLSSHGGLGTTAIPLPGDPLRAHTMYGTDFQSMKELSQKVQGAASEGVDGELGMDSLHGAHPPSSASFLLDGNFPLDIPPPSGLELVPEPVGGMRVWVCGWVCVGVGVGGCICVWVGVCRHTMIPALWSHTLFCQTSIVVV